MKEKIIYFYWGNQRMSFLRYMTIKSFNHFNPKWSIRLVINRNSTINTWTSSEEQDNVRYNGYDYRPKLNEIPNLRFIDIQSIFPQNSTTMSNVHIKDQLNWLLLSTMSCAVADMDIIFCNSIESGNGIDWDAHVNICNFDWYRNYMPVSFMLSNIADNGKNVFFEDVYKNSILNYSPQIYESCGSNCIGYKNIYEIESKYKELKINKMDHMTVFPFVNPDPSCVSDCNWDGDYSHLFTSNTIGVHWYGGQPKSQLHNNIITLENVELYDNTIVNIIKKILKK